MGSSITTKCQAYACQGNNFIHIEGNDIIHTLVVTKHLDNNTKCPKVLFCYDFVDGVVDKDENVLLVT